MTMTVYSACPCPPDCDCPCDEGGCCGG